MMKVCLIGATGNAGSRILAELARRGHHVTAIVRHPEKVPQLDGVIAHRGDANRVDDVAPLLQGHDVVVSSLHFLDGQADKLIGAAHISTARQGHITPLGEWKILEKRPFYRSKKYDNAPMPWMERIDEYGIALHGGGTPGRPESHGCIHLPNKFAEKLYGLTKIGTKVIIEG